MTETSPRQNPSSESRENRIMTPEDIQKVRERFEVRWGSKRTDQVTVQSEDGSQTIYETFDISVESNSNPGRPGFVENDDSFERFIMAASILGYRSAIGPVVIPPTRTFTRGGSPFPKVLLSLIRNEPTPAP